MSPGQWDEGSNRMPGRSTSPMTLIEDGRPRKDYNPEPCRQEGGGTMDSSTSLRRYTTAHKFTAEALAKRHHLAMIFPLSLLSG